MNTDNLIEAFNDIRDPYIEEYSKLTEKKAHFTRRKWWSYAACIIVLLSVGMFAVTHLVQQLNAQKESSRHQFSNYTELCDLLPNYHILNNIELSDYSVVVFEGFRSTSSKEPSEFPAGPLYGYEEYESIQIKVGQTDGIHYTVRCEVANISSVSEYEEARNPFQKATGEVEQQIVEGREVWYAKILLNDGNATGYTAIFSDKGDFFIVESSITNRDTFLRLISSMF